MCLIEPFPVQLARELGEEIAGHLFTDADGIRDEIECVDLRVRAGLQRVTVRQHEDLEPAAVLGPVSIKDVSAKRIEDKATGRSWLAFSFVLVFSLEDRPARNFVLDNFGNALLWSFERLQGELLDKAAMHEAAARLGEMGGTMTMTAAGPDGSVTGPIEFNTETAKRNRAEARRLRGEAKAH
jgi:hypothetical protein